MKSLHTLRRRRRRNEVKSIVSTGCYPVDTMTDVLQQLDLLLSFVAAFLQYVHELQNLSLYVLLSDIPLKSLQTLVTLVLVYSLCSLQFLVWSGGTDTNLQTSLFLCSGSAVFVQHLHNNCHLEVDFAQT